MDSTQISIQHSNSFICGIFRFVKRNLHESLLVSSLISMFSITPLLGRRYRIFYVIGLCPLYAAWIFFLLWRHLKKKSHLHSAEDSNDLDRDYLKNLTGLPTIFTYKSLETATGGFSKEIGKGGFGNVYEGKLSDGIPVAVKCLGDRAGQGQREFCAEIATISSINHSNLVSLRGLCAEGPHRILVYEFMANGSLDRWLFGSDKQLDWRTRYSIALETARGLAYLHEDSRLCILHLDIKPQNILLDENFKAKVSDFGMARSLDRDIESRVITQARGTLGYMAPEWFYEVGITSKSDVFSYGMVLLEIVSGRKNVDNSQDSDHWFFPPIAFNKFKQGKMEELIDSGLKLKRAQDMEEAYRLIKTALWSIQNNWALRPSMGTVVRMLEGDLDIMDPPLASTFPFVSAMASDNQDALTLLSSTLPSSSSMAADNPDAPASLSSTLSTGCMNTLRNLSVIWLCMANQASNL